MKDIDSYTERALEESGKTVRNYRRNTRNGVVGIEYDLLDRHAGACIGVAAGAGGTVGCLFGMAAALAAGPITAPVLVAGTFASLYAPIAVGGAAGAAIGKTRSYSYYFDVTTGELLGSTQNDAAEKLNSKGSVFWSEGNIAEALTFYNNAYYYCSSGYRNEERFKYNRDRAKAALDAQNLEPQANTEQNLTNDNDDRSGEVNRIFCANNAIEALRITIREEANVNNETSVISQAARELDRLEALWNNAWDAENDNRSEEASELFQELLEASENGSERYPNVLGFKQYEDLTSLKIEGNILFNEGIELQQEGITLLQMAHELRRQQDYESANTKFHAAKEKFSIALERFQRGAKLDERFASCVNVLQMQLQVVEDSIGIIESSLDRRLRNLNVSITNNDHSQADRDGSATTDHNITIQQL